MIAPYEIPAGESDELPWYDTKPANNVFVAYKAEVTAEPVGVSGSASVWEWYSAGCAIYMWSASCARPGTPLSLHYVPQAAQTEAIRCLVVGDEIAVDANQPLATRAQHIYWGPGDANQDGTKNELDANWVLQHVQWVKQVSDGELVNLNHGTQSYQRYDWYDCWFDEGYDDAWIHAVNAVEDALYIGYCLP